MTQLLNRCGECHSYDPGRYEGAPTLFGVLGRPVAGTKFPGYSTALSSVGGDWTKERLVAFLTDPEHYAPGTAMAGQGIGSAAEAEALVSMLEKLPNLMRY